MRVSGRALASKLKITEGAVRKAVARGILERSADGQFDFEKSRKAWDKNTNIRRETRKKPRERKPSSRKLIDLQTDDLEAKVTERQIRLGVLQGELVNAEKVRQEVELRASSERQALLNLPARYSATLAGELGIDEKLLRSALDRIIRLHLTERSTRSASGAND